MHLRFTVFILLFLVFMVTTGFPQMPALETGVSQTLAKWRAANYSDIRYKLNITLEKGAPLMKGDIEIHVTLSAEGAKNLLVLDWRTTPYELDKDKPFASVTAVNNNTENIRFQLNKEHLLIPNGLLKPGENVIKIQFASPIKPSGSAITRYLDKEDGGEYLYSLFVPSDASTAFPVFDQPDLKAKFSLNITIPESWKIIANEKEDHVSFNDDHTLSHNFNETKPISSYVFAFAAGDFAEFSHEGVPRLGSGSKTNYYYTRPSDKMIYVRRSQAEKFKQHATEVFRLQSEAVKYLESYFDFKFPFSKYDLVLIPEFPFGGMEHAGATFLREDSIIFPTEPTANNYISRANVIFHETAHQWFGDTVTMKWFDDLWLKEGFAEFMAYKTMEKVMPQYNAWKVFYERNKQAAYLTDSTRGTTPIYQQIPNLSAAKSAYGNIVYRKAPSFLRQAEFYLGEDKFQTAVRAFLKQHQYANATWQDLVKEFETASGENLKDWSNVWVTKPGMPILQLTEREYHEYEHIGQPHDTGLIFSVVQKDALGGKTVWHMKTKVFMKFEDGQTEIKTAEIDDEETTVGQFWLDIVKNPRFVARIPVFFFPNYQDYGYGIFLLNDRSRDYVLKNIQNEKDDFLRTMMWGSLWDSVREAELAPKDYVDLVIKNIGTETDESTIQTLLGRVSTAMNYYLSDTQRNEVAPRLESLLINKMPAAPTPGLRITYYRAFLNIASSDNARTLLKNLLKDSLKTVKDSSAKPPVLSMALKTRDKFDILTKLAVLGDSEAANLLGELVKTETSDDAKRYAYAVGAGFGTREVKEKYFNDFLNNKDISESWIEAALGSFNSSRHAQLTLPYLAKALAELPNLKRNRKIFFVNGWLGAFIGGQKSAEALQIVNKFLAANPNLDRDLRLKILENADGLERAVKIRAKYGKI